MFVCADVPKPKAHGGFDVFNWLIFPVGVITALHSFVDDAPDVVGIAVRVQCDLLLCVWINNFRYTGLLRQKEQTFAATRVRMLMRVQIASLGVDVTYSDFGTKSDI